MIDVKKNPSEELKKRINDVSGYRACKFVNAFTDMFHDDESLKKKDEAVDNKEISALYVKLIEFKEKMCTHPLANIHCDYFCPFWGSDGHNELVCYLQETINGIEEVLKRKRRKVMEEKINELLSAMRAHNRAVATKDKGRLLIANDIIRGAIGKLLMQGVMVSANLNLKTNLFTDVTYMINHKVHKVAL